HRSAGGGRPPGAARAAGEGDAGGAGGALRAVAGGARIVRDGARWTARAALASGEQSGTFRAPDGARVPAARRQGGGEAAGCFPAQGARRRAGAAGGDQDSRLSAASRDGGAAGVVSGRQTTSRGAVGGDHRAAIRAGGKALR